MQTDPRLRALNRFGLGARGPVSWVTTIDPKRMAARTGPARMPPC